MAASAAVGTANLGAALRDLQRALGARVIRDPDIAAAYAADHCALAAYDTPAAVVAARSEADVTTTLRIASAHRVPVVPRGSGSGLSGGANGRADGITLSTAGMARIIDVDAVDLIAVVEPGVLNGTLKSAVAELGLEYPPDPASAAFSSLGGNIATNAGGLCCVKYGVTRSWVLGLDVVRADGTTMRLGGRTTQNAAGLDLVGLLVGSEGTLGVVTRAVLRLRPRRPTPQTALAVLPSLEAAGRAVSGIRAAIVPSLLELMDGSTVRAVEAWQPHGLDPDAAAMLVVQSDAGGAVAAAELAVVESACREAGATDVLVASDETESGLLLNARRLAFPALERLGTVILDDVAVPCGRLPELLAGIEDVSERLEVQIGTFGHAGAGNMHPTIVVPGSGQEALDRARRAFDEIVALALQLGGSVTGEHGAGRLKPAWVANQLDEGSRRLQAEVRHVLDPLGILNPGRGY